MEWVVVAAGATGAGLLMLMEGQTTLGDYSADVRTELQAGEFQTDWTRDLPLQMD